MSMSTGGNEPEDAARMRELLDSMVRVYDIIRLPCSSTLQMASQDPPHQLCGPIPLACWPAHALPHAPHCVMRLCSSCTCI